MPDAPSPSPEPGEEDRRALPRETTRRRAQFVSSPAVAASLAGTVVDISPNGLCMHTAAPETVGQAIDIEIAAREGAEGETQLAVRGRVVWVKTLDDGRSAMGVRLFMDLLPASDPPAPPFSRPEDAREAVRRIRDALQEQPDGAPSPLAFVEYRRAEGEDPEAPPRLGLRRWIASGFAAVILLAIVLLASRCPREEKPPELSASKTGASISQEFADDNIAAKAQNSTNNYKPTGNSRITPRAIQLLEKAQSQLAAGNPEAALAGFRGLAAQGDAPPVLRFIGHIGEAQALAATGDREGALRSLLSAMGQGGDMPPAWQEMAEDGRAGLAGGVDSIPALAPLGDAALFEKAGATEMAATAPLRIDVDTSAYVLSLLEGDAALATYPVGLGSGGSTPHGEFRIAAKIEHPDWYNRGNVVKAGDPANPLGDYWMGLGNARGRTPYGIHPTAEEDSIGAQHSRGCIRMRPQDAADLFAHCDVGTPVRIHP